MPIPVAGDHNATEAITDIALNLSELFDHQTTVQNLLEEEGENATIETKALSVIISKTLQQTCSWVRTHTLHAASNTVTSF